VLAVHGAAPLRDTERGLRRMRAGGLPIARGLAPRPGGLWWSPRRARAGGFRLSRRAWLLGIDARVCAS